MFSATDKFGSNEKSWKITCIPSLTASLGDNSENSLSPKRIRPESGACTPDIILIKVDLPDPFSPAKQ